MNAKNSALLTKARVPRLYWNKKLTDYGEGGTALREVVKATDTSAKHFANVSNLTHVCIHGPADARRQETFGVFCKELALKNLVPLYVRAETLANSYRYDREDFEATIRNPKFLCVPDIVSAKDEPEWRHALQTMLWHRVEESKPIVFFSPWAETKEWSVRINDPLPHLLFSNSHIARV